MYYNYDRINSYNACFNFILTNRGYGKSYGAKEQAIKRFLKKGEQFMYVRRYKTELEDRMKFFDDIRDKFPNHKFEINGKEAKIDGKIAGYFVALSTSQKLKSVPYPFVTTILFDEFIIDKGHLRYLTNEVEVFLDLFETVARKRNNVRAYFLANNISLVNPYFIYFDLVPRKDERFTIAKDGEIIVELSTNDDFIQEKKNTRFGKIISGTKYSDYSIENKSLRDSETFIEELPLKECKPICHIFLNGQAVQIWINYKRGVFYCNDKIIDTTESFSLSIDDHTNNSLLNGRLLKFNMFNELTKYFQVGKVRFSCQNVKHLMYDIFNNLGLR